MQRRSSSTFNLLVMKIHTSVAVVFRLGCSRLANSEDASVYEVPAFHPSPGLDTGDMTTLLTPTCWWKKTLNVILQLPTLQHTPK